MSGNLVRFYRQRYYYSFFFQAEDGIRDYKVTGVQTCALPISIIPLFSDGTILLTQGFIGATDENESTTLGREGSDYTAAVFANMLNAESQTIWKRSEERRVGERV